MNYRAKLGMMLVVFFVFATGAPATEPSHTTAPASLREAAGDRLLVGAAIMSSHLDDPRLAALLASQFNSLTAENEMKPQSLQAQEGEFTFGPADKIAAFALRHDMKLVGHTLVWYIQSPTWMFEGPDKRPLPRDAALEHLRVHVDTVVKHFKGRVIGWDVVNEAIADGGGPGDYLRDTAARRAIGDDYVVKAFEFARAADPDVELYYNNYGIENPDKRVKAIRLIRELKKAGVRIDAVGIQCHFMMQYPGAPALLDEAVKAYAAEGVRVMVTELDVDVLPRAASGAGRLPAGKALDPYVAGLPAGPAKAQADFYRKTFDVARRHPDTLTRVTFWGVHDGASWLNGWPTPGRTNHPLLWDRDLRPKPAYGAVRESLSRASRKSAGERDGIKERK